MSLAVLLKAKLYFDKCIYLLKIPSYNDINLFVFEVIKRVYLQKNLK